MRSPPICSHSPAVRGARWPRRRERRTPASDAGGAQLAAALAGVTSLLAAAASLPRASDVPPAWLLPHQVESFARALAALRRHGTACVADPVGSGKTYVALAIAAAWQTRAPVACLVPAVLMDQWRGVAARLGVRVELHSHERVSRGRVPPCEPKLVIVDESHRFRGPTTRRYRTLAPWLVGRSALLLTGTPVVNHPADLLHQLRLSAADDTLAPFGVPSLGALLVSGCGHPALGRLIVMGTAGGGGGDARAGADARADRPRRSLREIGVADATIPRVARRLDALRLSAEPDVAALVRTSLLRALASSPAAFREALARYRRLLRHAADASAAGRPVTRRDLRLATGADEAQLVLWALLDAPTDASSVELDPGDLPALDALIGSGPPARADPKAERLLGLLSDERRSIVFVTHRATVVHLRDALDGRRVAWCTGATAGIGRARASRRAVLSAFDPALRERDARLDVLIATDVAAEGLDLQRAERIVHYDLPWTPMRLRQREGRAVRLGSPHAEIEVALFRLPEAIERRLGVARSIRRKELWPARLGLDRLGGAAALRDEARGFVARARTDGVELVRLADAPILVRLLAPAAARLGRSDTRPTQQRPSARAPVRSGELIVAAVAQAAGFDDADALVLWRRHDGTVVSDPVTIVERLRALRASAPRGAADVPVLVDAATRLLREYLGGTAPVHGHRALPAASADLVHRLTRLARDAARTRDQARLDLLDAALRFLRRGHTAGEAMVAAALRGGSDADLIRRLSLLPASPADRKPWRVAAALAVDAAASAEPPGER